jgi:hypothetical protein
VFLLSSALSVDDFGTPVERPIIRFPERFLVTSNGLSFKPSITLSAAIAALTEPHLLMITAVIGKKVPKHLYVVGEMESVPSAAPTTTGGHGWVA